MTNTLLTPLLIVALPAGPAPARAAGVRTAIRDAILDIDERMPHRSEAQAPAIPQGRIAIWWAAISKSHLAAQWGS